MAKVVSTTTDIGNLADAAYSAHLEKLNEHFRYVVEDLDIPIFDTDTGFGLWDTYMNSIQSVKPKQFYACSCCRHFIKQYGSLVTIGDNGKTKSVLWGMDDVMPEYKQAFAELQAKVEKANVTGVFLSSDKAWGTKQTDVWRHLAVVPQKERIYKDRLLTANQKMAERREDFKNVSRALGEFNQGLLHQAVQILESDALYRSEKVLGGAKWLYELQDRVINAPNSKVRTNLIWLAVAQAPTGFCHPRSSVFATLLEDLQAGLTFGTVKTRFAAKMHPLAYQRPQAAPKEGAIKAAEKVVATLGIAKSLERRHARFNEIVKLWRPTERTHHDDGVFGRLKTNTKAATLSTLTTVTITWDKFRKTVLPKADSMEFATDRHSRSYVALVTAVHADAPPILQWDLEDRRNPFSWYLYSGGSIPSSWCLPTDAWVKVNAVTLKPSMWDFENQYEHQGVGAIFILDGCRDSRSSGLALFPEILKSELHSVRATIEAFSNTGKLEGYEEANASGVMIDNSKPRNPLKLRVTSGSITSLYDIDRWD